MKVQPLGVPDAFVVTPELHRDERGLLLEAFRADSLEAAAGRSFAIRQLNVTDSRRGVVRGVHFTAVPPGQAKYVTCTAGAVLDVVVDLRVGSPTFGCHELVELDAQSRSAVFLGEGLGHAFVTTSDESTVVYLSSAYYRPEHDRGVSPFDPELTHTGLESGHSTRELTEHRGTPLAPRLSGMLSLSDSRN